MNLNHNGPDDGGLIVLKGSSALYSELYEAFEDKKPEGGWNTKDRHDHTQEQLQWLYDRGCKWEKVCAEPGDLLLWDSVSRFWIPYDYCMLMKRNSGLSIMERLHPLRQIGWQSVSGTVAKWVYLC